MQKVPMTDVTSYQTAYQIPSAMDALKSLAPSVFTLDSSPKASSKYQHVNTIDVINHLTLKGWQVDKAGETRVTKRTRERGLAPYVAHAVSLRHPDFGLGRLKTGDIVPNLIFGGSHNTSTVVWMNAGVYRCICDNQAVVSIGDMFSAKFRHLGGFTTLMENIYRSIDAMVERGSVIGETIQKWQSITLTDGDRYNYFRRVLGLRPDSKVKTLANENVEAFDFRRRSADTGNDLFTVYQVMQEHTMRGLRTPVVVRGRVQERSVARPIGGVGTFVDLNRSLWEVTDQFASEMVNA